MVWVGYLPKSDSVSEKMKDPPNQRKALHWKPGKQQFPPCCNQRCGVCFDCRAKKKREKEKEAKKKRNNKTDICLSLCCGTSRIKYRIWKHVLKQLGWDPKRSILHFLSTLCKKHVTPNEKGCEIGIHLTSFLNENPLCPSFMHAHFVLGRPRFDFFFID